MVSECSLAKLILTHQLMAWDPVSGSVVLL